MIVLTSNEEREFPPAFRRRCLQIDLKPPGKEDLITIARKKLSADPDEDVIEKFIAERGTEGRKLATDQLLNVLYLRLSGQGLSDADFSSLQRIVFASLSEPAEG